jgi:hypothetical protein
MDRKPWKLKWNLRVPKSDGQRVCRAAFDTESAARHEGQRLFDTVADSVTLTNDTLHARRSKVVKSWFRQGGSVRGGRC